MTYDNWKTTNPADEELGSQKQRTMKDHRRVTVVTNYWAKPIPVRVYDWQATLDGFEPDSKGPYGLIGHGLTEADAVCDLYRQINEVEEDEGDE